LELGLSIRGVGGSAAERLSPAGPEDEGSPMVEVTTGAQFIAEALVSWEVDHVFFMDAVLRETLVELERRGVRRILAHSEQGAAYMADGYARASGKLGVCMAQSVGAANLAAGLQDAYLNRTSVLALTGRKNAVFQYRNAYQELPHAPMFEAVTKFRADVSTPAQLPYLLMQAMVEATAGCPRPVHLDLDGYRGAEIENAPVPMQKPLLRQFIERRPPVVGVPDADVIKEAARRISRSARPMLVVGVGASHPEIGAALAGFAETFSVPIATSVGARSLVRTDHPLHFGVVGNYSAPYANEMLAQADLVIYAGCHVGDQVTCDWKVPAPGTPIIQIDIDPAEIGRNYPGVFGLVGAPAKVLLALARSSAARPARDVWIDNCLKARDRWLHHLRPRTRSDAVPIRAERLARELSDCLPPRSILVADTGFSATWTAQLTELRSPEQRYLRAAGSLGWAFPAAIGAVCAAPDTPVVCFTGDGAMYYHLSELETVRRWNLPLVVVINNNAALGQGLRSVRKLYEGRDGQLGDLVLFKDVNLAKIAQRFGIAGYRVSNPADIEPTIRQAVASREPCIVDVVTDPDCNPEPAWTPGARQYGDALAEV
jgi:acetolactate synthase-1/2/3 large subunit